MHPIVYTTTYLYSLNVLYKCTVQCALTYVGDDIICLISSGTAAAFRYTKEIFVPLYYACESHRCLYSIVVLLFSKPNNSVSLCQLILGCCTTHYRGNLLLILLPCQLQRGVPSTLPLRFDFWKYCAHCTCMGVCSAKLFA